MQEREEEQKEVWPIDEFEGKDIYIVENEEEPKEEKEIPTYDSTDRGEDK